MKNQVLERQAQTQIPEMLKEFFGPNVRRIKDRNYDFSFKFRDYCILVEFKGAGTVPLIHSAVQRFLTNPSTRDAIKIIAAPYIGEKARELCRENGLSWMDLSGNAEIKAPNIFIHVEGKENLFKAAGRPKNVFAPKSSRVTRCLLTNYAKPIKRNEIARQTGLTESFVGRVIRELHEQKLISLTSNGEVQVEHPDILLEAWRDAYDIKKHQVITGFVPYRTGEAGLYDISNKFESSKIDYLATGLAGAWLLSHFATFRLLTFYIKEFPNHDQLKLIGFKPQQSGNLWLILPNDDGVFLGAMNRESVRCAHPIQIYLDLKNLPERSSEAATMIKADNIRLAHE